MFSFSCQFWTGHFPKYKNLKKGSLTGPHHSFIPDECHPLLHSVDTFWDLSEVVFADGLLGHAEGAVCAASHAQVTTGRRANVTVGLNEHNNLFKLNKERLFMLAGDASRTLKLRAECFPFPYYKELSYKMKTAS